MPILWLIFLIVYQCPLKIMADQQPITMAALGRPFHLGMLYDVRSDRLISGITLWEPEKLEIHTKTSLQPYTGFEIITEDSLKNKANALGVEASLKLSLFAGLISVSGSAKYVDDHQRSNHVTRLTLKYSTTTRYEQLTMKQLGRGRSDHSSLHDIDVATHVVTGILYGADAFFLFDREVSKDEDKTEVSGTLQMMIKRIPTISVEGRGEFKMNQVDQAFVDNLNCKFYGDFHLDHNPSTINEAAEIYRNLSKRLGNHSERAVPKRVWLYPLHLIDSQMERFVRDISSKLIDNSISVIDNLHLTEIKTSDLLQSSIFTRLKYMKKHLSDFTARLSEFQRDLREKVALYLPQIRGNVTVQESILYDLFKDVDSSPFNQRKLDSWLDGKEQEIALMTTWVGILTKNSHLNITTKSKSRYEVMSDNKYDYIFCLLFHFVDEQDLQLTDMNNYLYHKTSFNSLNIHEKSKAWFQNRRTMSKIRKYLQQFLEFAEANNVENSRIKFIVDEEYSNGHSNESVELILYDDETEKKDFIIPSKPNAPYAKSITNDSLTLKWQDTVSGTEKIIKYKVMYREYNDDILTAKNENENNEKWVEIYTKSNHMEIFISNLTSYKTFVFKVQSITAIGLSTISSLSQPIKILAENEDEDPICACPCQNNGTCSAHDTCTCTGNWTGATCTIPVCRPACRNGGICISPNVCICLSNWTGPKCGKPICTSPCQNNGTCSAPDTCTCTANWTDATCATPICTPVCSNGGTCSSPNVCICTSTWTGERCTKSRPLRSATINIDANATWSQNGLTVAGFYSNGDGLNQLYAPNGLYVDDDQTIYVADHKNHRIVKYKNDVMNGQLVAGGNQPGNEANQLNFPNDMVLSDKETDSLIICDFGNNRVVRWPRRNGTNGETIISNIHCTGLAMDENGYLYVANWKKHEVRRYRIGDTTGILVAGGNKYGSRFDQLSHPEYIFVDRNHSVYVSDWGNNRVMKWEEGAKQGILVAGGQGKGNHLTQLSSPLGIIVDQSGTVYVADAENNRIMRWPKNAKQGTVIVAGNGPGGQLNQLFYPHGLSFDRFGNFYVVDHFNHRVQKFNIKQKT